MPNPRRTRGQRRQGQEIGTLPASGQEWMLEYGSQVVRVGCCGEFVQVSRIAALRPGHHATVWLSGGVHQVADHLSHVLDVFRCRGLVGTVGDRVGLWIYCWPESDRVRYFPIVAGTCRNRSCQGVDRAEFFHM